MELASLDPRRANPAKLAEYASGGNWEPARHLHYLSQVLFDLAIRRVRRVIVNMPPQHGKSELCSRYFPAWYLSGFPNHRIVLTSYESRYAKSWGRKARDTVKGAGDVLGVRIDPEVSAAGEWDLRGYNGGMFSVGMGGAITGRAANCLIIDDFIKNSEEAMSPTIRNKHWDWYRSVAKTRMSPDGVILIVATRWHEDDLIGRILDSDEDNEWHVIKLQGIAKPGDPLGREPGEALWPERYGRDFMLEQQRDLLTYWYSSLYDQDPQPESGMMVQRSHFRYFRDAGSHFVLTMPGASQKRVMADRCRWFQTCDTAQKDGEENDYTVVSTFVACPDGELLVYDVFREKIVVPKQYQNLENQRMRYPELSFQAVEEKNAGVGIIQQGRLEGNPFRVLKARGSKKTRFTSASIFYENGSIYHRRGAPWLTDLEDEVLKFPNAKHDDIADTIAYGAILMQNGLGPVRDHGTGRRVVHGRKPLGSKRVRR